MSRLGLGVWGRGLIAGWRTGGAGGKEKESDVEEDESYKEEA
jgi:hypothetical protein